jgi:hypothetical protein
MGSGVCAFLFAGIVGVAVFVDAYLVFKAKKQRKR